MNTLIHPFDILNEDGDLELFAEELPEQVQTLSDCLGSNSCVVTDVRRWAASFGPGPVLKK